MPHRLPLAALLWGLLALPACGDEGYVDPYDFERPLLTEARPERGWPGAEITVIGQGFGLQGEADGLWLAGAPVSVISWSDRVVIFEVPPAAGYGIRDLVMRAGDRVSPPLPLSIGPEPEE